MFSILDEIIRWAVEEIGRNSVTPSTIPKTIAFIMFIIKNVIPAKAGIQTKITLFVFKNVIIDWIPFFKGMTTK